MPHATAITLRAATALWVTLVLSALHVSPIMAQQGLAPSVEADLLRDKIYVQAKANDADGVIASLDQYHKLVDANKLTFPVPLYWIEAKAARDTGDARHAFAALTEFLNKADHGSTEYKEGLALYPAYEQAVKDSEALQDDARRAALIARVPEVIQSIRESLVEIPEGQFSCPAKNFSCAGLAKRPPIEVRKFHITKCFAPLWWEVFVADTDRGEPPFRSDYREQPCSDFITFQRAESKPTFGLDTSPSVSIADLETFVAWVSSHDGGKWRWPTEAELGIIMEEEASQYPRPRGRNPFFLINYQIPVSDCWEFDPSGAWRTTSVCEKKSLGLVSHTENYPDKDGGQVTRGWEEIYRYTTPGPVNLQILLVRED